MPGLIPRAAALPLRERANRARGRGDWSRAARLYDWSLRINPDNHAIRIQLGHMLREAGDSAASERAYAAAAVGRPNDADLMLCWGHLRKSTGDLRGADQLYRRSMAIDGTGDAPAEHLALAARLIDPIDAAHAIGLTAPDAGRPLAWSVRMRSVKAPPLRYAGEAAVLLARCRTGSIRPHVHAYATALRAAGIAIVLVAETDRPLRIEDDLIAIVDGLLVRDAAGDRFAGWAHVLKAEPALYGASRLYLLDDSVLGCFTDDRFGALLDEVRQDPADLVGLTEAQDGGHHLQSYFLALRPTALGSRALHILMGDLRLSLDATDSSDHDRMLATCFRTTGLTISCRYPGLAAIDPITRSWSMLLDRGFPFVQLPVTGSEEINNDATPRWAEIVARGFDRNAIDVAIADNIPVPKAADDRLLMHEPDGLPTDPALLRVALFAPWNQTGTTGDAGRALLAALRRTPVRLNAYPIVPPLPGQAMSLPPAAEIDFEGAADIAIVQLDPAHWPLLTTAQADRIAWSHRRIACIGYGTAVPAALPPWQMTRIDHVWTSNDQVAAILTTRGAPPFTRLAPPSALTPDALVARLRLPLHANLLPDPAADPAVPSLRMGRPFAAGYDARHLLHHVPLAPDGSVPGLHNGMHIPGDALIAFAPAGSVTHPDFANIITEHAATRPDASLFYADDVAVETDDANDRIRLKPAFDRTLLMAQDYVGAPLIVRAATLSALGGLNAERGTAAVADLLFRADAAGIVIARIPHVLIGHPGRRVQATGEALRDAVAAQPAFAGHDIVPGPGAGTSLLRRRFTPETMPPVTLVIPTRRSLSEDGRCHIAHLLVGLCATDWPADRLRVLVGDDIAGPADWMAGDWPFPLQRIETHRPDGDAFNYAAKMNQLWQTADTEQIVFLNDDVRPLGSGWLKALQTFALDPTVGGVGARLLYPDGRLQHAGIAPQNIGASHLWVGRQGTDRTYQDWAQAHREWSMVTGAVFATRRSVMEQVGGFDERFSLEFNDTDLCLRLRKQGYRIIYTPDAELVHLEKASRGTDPAPPHERALFLSRWRTWLDNDPSWHPGFQQDQVQVTPNIDAPAWYV